MTPPLELILLLNYSNSEFEDKIFLPASASSPLSSTPSTTLTPMLSFPPMDTESICDISTSESAESSTLGVSMSDHSYTFH